MSSIRAQSYHSITIGERNTWDNWYLVPTSRPLVNPPQVKTHYVNVPGRNGALDLTEAIAGRAVYGNRTGNWEFYVMNPSQIAPAYSNKMPYGVGDFCIRNNRLYQCNTAIPKKENWNSNHWTLVYTDSNSLWQSRYTTIMQYLQGQEFDVILDDDHWYYYHGRLAVDQWKSSPGNSTIVIAYNLEPYKMDARDVGGERWLWDPFYFGTPDETDDDKGDMIRSYKNLQVKGSLTVTYVLKTEMSPHPLITCSAAGMTVKFNGTTYNLHRGQNEMTQFTLSGGENTLIFTGNGRVTIQATGGIL